MKVLTEGYSYEVYNFEQDLAELNQHINFIHKVPESEGSATFRTVKDGTTNEEVLAVLIDRMNYLQGKFPCRENDIVITKLEECLMWLKKRTADRKARGVEGQHAK